MFNSKTIQKTVQKSIALFLLVVFAFSITPQKNIHDFVAKHIDPTSCKVHVNLPIEQVEHSTVHCSYDQLVVTAPFEYKAIAISISSPSFSIEQKLDNVLFRLSNTRSIFDTRGPPVI